MELSYIIFCLLQFIYLFFTSHAIGLVVSTTDIDGTIFCPERFGPSRCIIFTVYFAHASPWTLSADLTIPMTHVLLYCMLEMLECNQLNNGNGGTKEYWHKISSTQKRLGPSQRVCNCREGRFAC